MVALTIFHRKKANIHEKQVDFFHIKGYFDSVDSNHLKLEV